MKVLSAETPLLGLTSFFGGSVFVERRSPAKLRQEMREIRAILEAGMDVMVFAEATSSDGRAVLPFKRALFQAVVDSPVPVVPICLSYGRHGLQEEEIHPVCYYGDHEFGPHFWRLTALKRISVEVRILPSRLACDFAGGSREMAEESEKLVSEAYQLNF